MAKHTIEIYVAMNEDGGFGIGKDEEEASIDLTDNEGGYRTRIVKLSVTMDAPIITEAEVTVPDEPSAEVEATAASGTYEDMKANGGLRSEPVPAP